MGVMSQEQRKAPAQGSSSLRWCHRLPGAIAGTLKWKEIWILQDIESLQLATSLGILVRFDFLLDLKSFFALCDGWLDYRSGSLTITSGNWQMPKWHQVPLQRKPSRSFPLCLCGLSPNMSWTEPACAGLGDTKCSMPIYWCALFICSVA